MRDEMLTNSYQFGSFKYDLINVDGKMIEYV